VNERLSVTWLAAFFHRRGDLHAGVDGWTRGEEGIRVQRVLQQERLAAAVESGGVGYQRERNVSLAVPIVGRDWLITGRIDGCDLEATPLLIEEFKTTRTDPQRAHAQNRDEHWAQTRLYAGMLRREGLGERGFLLRLCYCHPDTLAVTRFEEELSAADAERFLADTLADLETWIVRQHAHEAARDARLSELGFPYAQFRPHQRAIAHRVYRAIREREGLLLEAPTGSGKTAATLYPVMRALGAGACRRVFFLTSRNTGARAAHDALDRMDPDAAWLRRIRISARDTVCIQDDGAPCEGRTCPRAIGYYDRARAAVLALLARCDMTPATIGQIAAEHRVCPHELALDAALWSDVVIGDYNYVFDPSVRLQRFAGETDSAVLIDEAHQLVPRVRDMLSVSLARSEIHAALTEDPPEPLARRLRGIDRQFLALLRATAEAADEAPQRSLPGAPALGAERLIEAPTGLLRALERFCDAVFDGGVALESWPATLALFFNASRWLREIGEVEQDGWIHRLATEGGGPASGSKREARIDRDCLEPSTWIAARLGEYGGHVRFSGTVSPLPLYQLLHGLVDAPAERGGNPFRSEQLEVLLVGDLPTYLQARSRTLERLVALVHDVVAARSGHYLVAFPSFEYLRQFAAAFAAGHPEWALAVQSPGMSEAEREAFLAGFRDAARPRIGLVVLGGVFGESVDFADACLAGVICVGLGLPPPSLARDAIALHFDRRGADGRTIAYLQPAMVKVVQMAGRLLRGPDDRGVLCLVDPRFADPDCRQFFPSHWRPVRIRAADVAAALANFWQANVWQERAGFPRLRATEQETPT
jgi:Rad3-related DNA helicase